MYLFAVAVETVQRECGPYSRAIREALSVYPVLATDPDDAWRRVTDGLQLAPGWTVNRTAITRIDDRMVIDAAAIAERLEK